MRSIPLHPASLVVGLAFGFVCFLAMGQTTITPAVLGSTVRVEYLAHPRDVVTIRGGTPYVVPAGKIFVLTALGGDSGPLAILKVNGTQEVSVIPSQSAYGSTSSTTSVLELAPGFAVSAGNTIEVCGAYGSNPCLELSPRAWGYLAPQ